YDAGSFTENDIRWELRAVKNARATLMAGFTSVRELGGTYFGDTSLRDAINDGDIVGPRIAACGMQMSITGGHADAGASFSSDLDITGRGVADGVEGVQKKVREIIKFGADVINVMASGGVTSPKDDPTAAAYSLQELKAIVDDAHRLGHKVAAHAHSTQGIMFAVEAGVDSIEHGSYIDDAGIALMKKQGTYLVPTLYLHRYALENLDHLPWPEAVKQHERAMIPVIRQNIRHAVESGVKIAFGTDAAMFPHGLNAREFSELIAVGLTPLQAIQAATINAADLMGWSKDAGTIEPGKFADLIAVKGNPLQNVSTLEDVKFVMKAGVVYRGPEQSPAKSSDRGR
ncbi:MAG TPA: amidohydrolase family protein, partial [Terriglobales bacterium]|nr:amidohydrolase family protein [Terriglobales bacterium]